jgi:hypothetical protein
MKRRKMSVILTIITGKLKDRHVDSQFNNAIDELLEDTVSYDIDMVK